MARSKTVDGDTRQTRHEEIELTPASGWFILSVIFATLLVSGALLAGFLASATGGRSPTYPLLVLAILGFATAIFLMPGMFVNNPNTARLMMLFGDYKGTVRQSGLLWVNPFYTKAKLSLRVMNLEVAKLKVNDKGGNPIEIAAVVLWRIADTAQAVFDVANVEDYVRTQSESALRHLANSYPYDHGEEGETTLRSAVGEVSDALRRELQERCRAAGVAIDESRLTHLAYAPEISAAMLRRQQAEAVIAARQKIVHGAVSMVEMALRDLASRDVVELDNDRKAAMVSNLLVVLCSESEATPVINAGTLYP